MKYLILLMLLGCSTKPVSLIQKKKECIFKFIGYDVKALDASLICEKLYKR